MDFSLVLTVLPLLAGYLLGRCHEGRRYEQGYRAGWRAAHKQHLRVPPRTEVPGCRGMVVQWERRED